MPSPRVESVLFGCVLICGVIAVVRWSNAPLGHAQVFASPVTIAARFGEVVSDTLAEPVDASGMSPFRFSRTMPEVRFGETALPEPIAGTAYRPTLSLKGIIGGPPWTALIGGIPGRRGPQLLAVHDRTDSLMVKSIGQDSVVISGPDTVWTLRLGRGRP